jgi:hypothetical protein
MVKVTHLSDDGTEMASIELDDFTIEVIYAGLAAMLRDAAVTHPGARSVQRTATPGAPAPPARPQPLARLTTERRLAPVDAPKRGVDQDRKGAPLR